MSFSTETAVPAGQSAVRFDDAPFGFVYPDGIAPDDDENEATIVVSNVVSNVEVNKKTKKDREDKKAREKQVKADLFHGLVSPAIAEASTVLPPSSKVSPVRADRPMSDDDSRQPHALPPSPASSSEEPPRKKQRTEATLDERFYIDIDLRK